jgi:hypothetical protein
MMREGSPAAGESGRGQIPMPPIKDLDERLKIVVADALMVGDFGGAGNTLFAADRFDEAIVVYALQRTKTSMKAPWDNNIHDFLVQRQKPGLIVVYDALAGDPAALQARKTELYGKLGLDINEPVKEMPVKEVSRERMEVKAAVKQPPIAAPAEDTLLKGKPLDYKLAVDYLRDGDWRTAGAFLLHAGRAMAEERAALAADSAVCFAIHRGGIDKRKQGMWDEDVQGFYAAHEMPQAQEEYDRLRASPGRLVSSKSRLLAKYGKELRR